MVEVRTNVRIPEQLYGHVKALAQEDIRSINAEVVILLKEAVARRMKLRKEALEDDSDQSRGA